MFVMAVFKLPEIILGREKRLQIEDIVTRKTGVAPENIVITPMSKKADQNTAQNENTSTEGKTTDSEDGKETAEEQE